MVRAHLSHPVIRTVRLIAFLEQWLENEAVLFDESLSQKVYAVMPWDRGNKAHARRYFEQMSLPAALIHLDADATQALECLVESLGECREALAADDHLGVAPATVGKPEMVDPMVEGLTADRNHYILDLGEV